MVFAIFEHNRNRACQFSTRIGNCKRFRASFAIILIVDSEVFYENCICMFGQYLPCPMAEFVMKSNRPTKIESRATSGWEHGCNPDIRNTGYFLKKYAISYDRDKDFSADFGSGFADFDYTSSVWMKAMSEI